MDAEIKTVDDWRQINQDPLDSVKKENTDRMRMELLSCSAEDPRSIASAVQRVTILRVYHQVTRIVQYLDKMDKLEEALYKSIDIELANCDLADPGTLVKLLAIQERLQKTMIESNKLLQPYLEMDHQQAFDEAPNEVPVEINTLDGSSSDRNLLRENAASILSDLKSLDVQVKE